MKKKGIYDEKKLVFSRWNQRYILDLPPSPIYRGHPDKPMVSFIINVAWGNEYYRNPCTSKKAPGISKFFS